jgi:hypothetical protein
MQLEGLRCYSLFNMKVQGQGEFLGIFPSMYNSLFCCSGRRQHLPLGIVSLDRELGPTSVETEDFTIFLILQGFSQHPWLAVHRLPQGYEDNTLHTLCWRYFWLGALGSWKC